MGASLFLVACFWPGVTRAQVEAVNERARPVVEPVGVYQVHITDRTQTKVRPIDDCLAVASPARVAIGTIGIEATRDGWSFFVWTTAGGAFTGLPFCIVAHCPKPEKGA